MTVILFRRSSIFTFFRKPSTDQGGRKQCLSPNNYFHVDKILLERLGIYLDAQAGRIRHFNLAILVALQRVFGYFTG
jgi:hypothetical protein